MDLRKLKTLIDLVSESNVSELEITEAEGKVRIVKAPPVESPELSAWSRAFSANAAGLIDLLDAGDPVDRSGKRAPGAALLSEHLPAGGGDSVEAAAALSRRGLLAAAGGGLLLAASAARD